LVKNIIEQIIYLLKQNQDLAFICYSNI